MPADQRKTVDRGAVSRRIEWLDRAKGVGIVFVVLGHALGGIIDAPRLAAPPIFRELFFAIYLFHMPLFFMLAGLLVARRLQRGAGRFMRETAIGVVYPYFLWSIVQYLVIFAAGSLVNSPVSTLWKPIVRLPVATVSQFWFLYILFFFHVAAALLVPRIGVRGFMIVAWLIKLAPALLILPTLPRLFLIHFGFYALGVWLALEGMDRLRQWIAPRGWVVAPLTLVALCGLLVTTALTFQAIGPHFAMLKSSDMAAMAWHLPMLPAALLAMTACLALAFAVQGQAGRMLATLGRHSMSIFVLHVMVIAGTRILLVKLGLGQPIWLLLLACVTLGIMVPLAVRLAMPGRSTARYLGLG